MDGNTWRIDVRGTKSEDQWTKGRTEFIEDIAKLSNEEGLQMCGLDCSEMEQERVLEVVSELEREAYNQVVTLNASGGGAIKKEELAMDYE